VKAGGPLRLRELVASREFGCEGIALRRHGDCWLAFVDPEAHPLYVWKRAAASARAYARTAQALDAVVFTNGPMMGKRISANRKVTRRLAAREVATCIATGTALGVAAGRSARGCGGGGAVGAAAAATVAWRRCFTDWVPCGHVFSSHNVIDDRRNFDVEGDRHSWFGRFADDFDSYGIGEGNAPPDLREGAGGLIRLVVGYATPGDRSRDRCYDRDYAELRHKKGVTAWGLIPLSRARGCLVVLGSRGFDLATAATLLCTLGTRDAVALDQRGMITMGTRRRFLIGPPSMPRQAMQTYGLYCGSAGGLAAAAGLPGTRSVGAG
jgi:hypothetical protein